MYQLTNTTSIRRISDNATIPADVRNADYRAYLEWVAAENTPLPADTPARDIEGEQLALLDAYTLVENRNITPAGAVQMDKWAMLGVPKAVAVKEWVSAHWAEFRTKQAALAVGGNPVPTPSSLWKPFSFDAISNEAQELYASGGGE